MPVAVASLMLVAIERLLGHTGLGWWWSVPALAAFGAVYAGVAAFRAAPTHIESAWRLDRAMKLDGRLAVAAELVDGGNRSDAFETAAQRGPVTPPTEAEVRRAIPLRLASTRQCNRALAIMALALGVAFLVPPADLLGKGAHRAQASARLAAQNALAAQLSHTRDQIPKPLEGAVAEPDRPTMSDASADELARLAELESELLQGRADPRAASGEAASLLTQLANRTDEAAAERRRNFETVRDALRSVSPQEDSAASGEVPPSPAGDSATPSTELARALSEGRFDRAAQALRELAESEAIRRQSAEDVASRLEQIARDLEQLSEQGQRAADPPTPPQPQPRPQPQREADQPDLPRPVEPVPEQLSPESSPSMAPPPERSPSEAEREQPRTSEAESQPAGQRTEPSEQPGQPVQREDPRRELAREMRQAAEDLRRTDPDQARWQPERDRGASGQEQPSAQRESGQAPPDASDRSPTPTRQQPGPTAAPDPSAQPAPRPDPAPTSEPSTRPAPSGTSTPERQPTQAQPTDEQTQPQSTGSPAPSTHGAETPQRSEGSDQPQPDGSESPDGQPSMEGVRRLAERMERLGRTPQDLAQDRRAAEDLRKRAEEFMRQATPEQRREIEQMAQDFARQQGRPSPDSSGVPGSTDQGIGGSMPGLGDTFASDDPGARFRTEPVDARPSAQDGPSGEQVVAEWLGPGGRAAPDSASQQAASAQLDRAASRAERAMRDRTISPRYDPVLRRYFERLPRRVLGGPDAESPIAPAAPDATSTPAGSTSP